MGEKDCGITTDAGYIQNLTMPKGKGRHQNTLCQLIFCKIMIEMHFERHMFVESVYIV